MYAGPGQKFSVMRSAPGTTPTKIVWASSGYIDFVEDCGADPTGVTDCAPAFDAAYALIQTITGSQPQPINPIRLRIPDGVYSLRSAPVHTDWNFSSKATAVEIIGAGIDATILQLSGFDPPSISAPQSARLADFTVQGVNTPPTVDCTYGFLIEATQNHTVVERVRFFNVQATKSAFYSFVGQNVHFVDCEVSCCSSQTDNWGCITVEGFTNLHYESCTHQDIGQLNGVSFDGNKLLHNRSWLVAKGNSANAGNAAFVSVSDCFFDENTKAAFKIIGESSSHIRAVFLKNILVLPPIQTTVDACASISYVDECTIFGLTNTGFNSATTAATLRLATVVDTHICGLGMKSGSASNVVVADSGCTSLTIENAPLLIPNNLQSSAFKTLIKTNTSVGDVWCRHAGFASATNSAVGSALKFTTSGSYTLLAASDPSAKCVGVATAVQTNGDNIWCALPGQIVPAISDGVSVPAVGDNIMPSAATAGQSKKVAGAVGTIGTCVTAPVTGSGQTYTMWLQNGVNS